MVWKYVLGIIDVANMISELRSRFHFSRFRLICLHRGHDQVQDTPVPGIPPTAICTNGDVQLGYGSPEFIGLGFSVMVGLVFIELFGSVFMKNCNGACFPELWCPAR